jgi:ubiquitin fusion degradation protein 1
MLRISTVSLEQGKLIKIRPRERSFIEISNPKRVLEDHLRDHHVLTKGSTIVIFYADIEFRIDIMDIIGRDGRSIDGVSTVNARNVERGTELQVEFMRPLDMPPSPPQDTLAPPAGNRTPPPQGANVIQGQQGVSFTPMVFQPPSLTPPTSAEAKPASQPVASFTAFAGSGRSLGGGRQPPAGAPAASSQPPAPAPSSTGGSFTAFGGQGRSLR